MSTMVAIQPRIEAHPETLPQAEVRNGITPEELLAMPDGGHYELIDGELKERKVSALSHLIAHEVGRILGNHCRAHDLGWLFAADHGYQCFPWKPGRVRRADVAFIQRERYPWEELSNDGFTTIPPDLAVEVVSPNDLASEVDEKVAEYLRAGVKLVWVVHPAVRDLQVFRNDRSVSWLWDDAELSGEAVIPGFRCRVADLFPGPAPEEVTTPAETEIAPEAPPR